MGVVRPWIQARPGRLTRQDQAVLRSVPLGVILNGPYHAGLKLAARRLLREGDKEVLSAKRKEEFSMLFTAEHRELLRHLREESRHPMIAAELFSLCMDKMDWDTGEVKLSRHQLANELGVKPDVVSLLMGELAKCGAIRRSFKDADGNRVRAVRYFVSCRIATHERSSAARDASQAAAPPLRFGNVVSLSARPTERRSRAASFEVPLL